MKRFVAAAFVFAVWAILMNASGIGGCGSGAGGDLNPNFPDLSNEPVQPTTAIDPDDTDQVTTVEAESDDQAGKIGTIADQDPARVLCVIIDPADGNDADLEVCEADRVNEETDSVNGLCPEADAVSRCASSNSGSGPDFCQVTGAPDYAFVIMNLTSEDVTVAYQVVDVTDQPGQSCADLNITEDSIEADGS
jgi:hypothetical protein